jgi:hypothetical protein
MKKEWLARPHKPIANCILNAFTGLYLKSETPTFTYILTSAINFNFNNFSCKSSLRFEND